MIGVRVEIKVGDEKGSWGIIRLQINGEYHVAIAGGNDVRVYERREITVKRET